MKSTVFWFATPCSFQIYRRFRGTDLFHHCSRRGSHTKPAEAGSKVSDMFLRNVRLSSNYTVLQRRRLYVPFSLCCQSESSTWQMNSDLNRARGILYLPKRRLSQHSSKRIFQHSVPSWPLTSSQYRISEYMELYLPFQHIFLAWCLTN
jgi:hypothetical protein